jgi:hypothetical protein
MIPGRRLAASPRMRAKPEGREFVRLDRRLVVVGVGPLREVRGREKGGVSRGIRLTYLKCGVTDATIR